MKIYKFRGENVMPDERKRNMKYFDIHVTYDNAKDGAGYSIFVKANTSNEDKVLQYALTIIYLRKMEMKSMLII